MVLWEVLVQGDAYPFLWFFLAWLCWDEFFDSVQLLVLPDSDSMHSDPTYWPWRRCCVIIDNTAKVVKFRNAADCGQLLLPSASFAEVLPPLRESMSCCMSAPGARNA